MYSTIIACAASAAGIRRITKMTNKAMTCVRNIGIGAAVGAAAGIICKCAADNRRHTLRYRARHAADVMEDLINNVTYMFR